MTNFEETRLIKAKTELSPKIVKKIAKVGDVLSTTIIIGDEKNSVEFPIESAEEIAGCLMLEYRFYVKEMSIRATEEEVGEEKGE